MIQDWGLVTLQALQSIWKGFLDFIPTFLAAVIVFIIGWFISVAIGKIVAQILLRLRFNKLFEKTGWKESLEKAELKVNPSDFVGAICKWILVIVFLMAAIEILGFVQFALFLERIIAWIPNLVVAIAIFVVAVIMADILEKIVRASVKRIDLKYVDFLGVAVRWAIYVFAAFAILLQLGITPTIINTLVMGFIGMITLALGLAFGLGGKDAAAKFIEDFKEKISEK